MTALTPDQIAQKWAQNLQAAAPTIQASVQAVTVAPGQAAARQKAQYVQGIIDSQDKWARNVAAVPLQSWQTAMIQKGVPRIASGATAAQGEFGQFMTRLIPFINNAVAGLPPRGNLEANIQRSAAMIRAMSTFSA